MVDVHVHGGCSQSCFMSMSMLYVHICPCCLSMLMYLLQYQVHVQTASPYPCPCRLSVFVGVCGGVCVCVYSYLCAHVLMLMYKCQNAGLSSIHSVWYQNEKTSDAGTGPVTDQACTVWHFFGPVPDWNYGSLNADIGISFLNADAQLWSFTCAYMSYLNCRGHFVSFNKSCHEILQCSQ